MSDADPSRDDGSITLPARGSPAPDFRWEEDGESHALSELRGQPVLLLFYPLAYAHTDRDDIVSLDKAADELGAGEVHRLAISVDDPEQGRHFFGHYDVHHLRPVSDPGLDIAGAYGVARDERVSERASVLIDSEGCVVDAVVHDFCFPRPVALLGGWLSELRDRS